MNNKTSSFTSNMFSFFMKRSYKEVMNRLCYFFISFGACFLAIFTALIANTVISQAPLIFLSIAETTEGEIDLRFSPSSIYYSNDADSSYLPRFFNMTKIDLLTQKQIGLLAPRLQFHNTYAIKEKKNASLSLLVIDSEREKRQKIGVRYKAPILKEGECAIPRSIAEFLKIKERDSFKLSIHTRNYLELLPIIYNETGDFYDLWKERIEVECTVGSIFDNLKGKVPSDDDDKYIWLELKHFTKLVATAICKDEAFRKFISNLNPYDLVSEIVTNHPNREQIYLYEDFYKIQKSIADYSTQIVSQLGFYPLNSNMPILRILLPLNMGAIFLNIVLNLIVILLTLISTFLIYSLLTISVESRTFEFGIIRMLGITKIGLACLVLVQATLFVLPAFVLAFVLSFPGLGALSILLKSKLGFAFSTVPTTGSIIWALCVGIIVPTIASILPIRQVIRQSLIESLDTQRSKSQGVHITIEYAQKGNSLTMIAFGSVAIIYGLSIYYFLPLTLLSMNLQFMLWIMLSLLLAIIVGLILLSLNATHLIERLLVTIFLVYETSVMRFLILKNLIAHKLRNRRTIIIYSLSLGFLLFAIVAYTMELRNVQLYMLSKHESYLIVYIHWSGTSDYSAVIKLERELLVNYANEVEDFTWETRNIDVYSKLNMDRSWVSDFGRKYTFAVNFLSVSPNFFEVANEMFINIHSYNDTSSLSLGEQLYTPRGSQGIGTGSFLLHELNLDVKNPKNTYLLVFERSNTDLAFETRSLFALNSCPGLHMNRKERRWQNVVSSIPLYLKFGNILSLSLVRWRTLTIKIKDNNLNYHNKVYKGLNRLSLDLYVWSYASKADQLDGVKEFLDIIFMVIIILFMLLSFFSLSSSMTANILEQSKELAIIRSIGITRKRTVFLHIYEAFTLVLTGSLIGAGIGMLIGYTLSLQRVLFTELPLKFIFPYKHLVTIFAVSVVCAILSTASPSIYLLKKPIAELSRN